LTVAGTGGLPKRAPTGTCRDADAKQPKKGAFSIPIAFIADHVANPGTTAPAPGGYTSTDRSTA